jgi:glycyl-tRNA synthetase beta chain
MIERLDLLVEIQTEELPPKALPTLIDAFAQKMRLILAENKLDHGDVHQYATPRRLALHIEMLLMNQPDQVIARRGPRVQFAYDETGALTKAGAGFAQSCGVSIEQLGRVETDKGDCLYVEVTQAGQLTKTILGDMINRALSQLPIPKPMRWGSLDTQFIRPVHSAMVLLGKEVIPVSILGVMSQNTTRGHRFLCQEPLIIKQAMDYSVALRKKGHVIADFNERKTLIEQGIHQAVSKHVPTGAFAVIDAGLLEEVTALVEWPEVLIGHFDETFLTVPSEALISAMQGHQKCFSVKNERGKLLPYFVIVSNIASTNPAAVIRGNERVMHARLSDAAFFYNTDSTQKLSAYQDTLATITYQEKLGSVYDKTKRIVSLATYIAEKIGADAVCAARAADLCKADLVTQMVGEFPELQGVMGAYYAKNDGENVLVVNAIRAHYLPRFASDHLPDSKEGAAVALADRIDSLVGLFGVGLLPSGDKDPFGLKRAALALIRIIVEMNLHLDMTRLIQHSAQQYATVLALQEDVVRADLMPFVNERFRSYALEQGISSDVFHAVRQVTMDEPLSAYRRMQAVQLFKAMPQAASLAAANKRVSNILSKVADKPIQATVDERLFEKPIETQLAHVLSDNKVITKNLIEQGDYTAALCALATSHDVVNQFFDEVMIMVDDPSIQANRLALLLQLRQLFLQIADIAVLQ